VVVIVVVVMVAAAILVLQCSCFILVLFWFLADRSGINLTGYFYLFFNFLFIVACTQKFCDTE